MSLINSIRTGILERSGHALILVAIGLAACSDKNQDAPSGSKNARPTIVITATPATITSGETSTLDWTANNSTTCTAPDGVSSDISGTYITPPTSETRTYTVTCTGSGGTLSQDITVTVEAPAPTVTLTLDPASVPFGKTSKISWTSTNSTSCLSSDGGGTGTTGIFTTSPITSDTYYIVLCMGPGGNASKSMAVTVAPATPVPVVAAKAPVARQAAKPPSRQPTPITVDPDAPTVTLTATPSQITYGAKSTISWTSSNSTTCSSTGGGGTGPQGSFTVTALARNTSYTVTCTGPHGSATQSTTVSIGAFAAPAVALTATPTSIASGGRSTINWTAAHSTHCTSSGGGGTGTSGSFITPALTTSTSYSVICTGPGGTASKVISIALAKAPAKETPVGWVLSE